MVAAAVCTLCLAVGARAVGHVMLLSASHADQSVVLAFVGQMPEALTLEALQRTPRVLHLEPSERHCGAFLENSGEGVLRDRSF